jgi:sugar phosphate isomerase/epimerase
MLVTMRSRDDNPTLEEWDEQIECAKLLNAHIVTDLNSLGIPETHDLNGCDCAAEIIQLAQQNDVKLCIETGRLSLLKQVGKRFDSIWFCLDTGFANVNSEHSFKEYVDELSPRIAHLHLTDNYGSTDDHVVLGLNGQMSRENWEYLLYVLQNQDNDIIGSLEMCPPLPGVMIRQASEFLFDALKWPNKPQKTAWISTLLS